MTYIVSPEYPMGVVQKPLITFLNPNLYDIAEVKCDLHCVARGPDVRVDEP